MNGRHGVQACSVSEESADMNCPVLQVGCAWQVLSWCCDNGWNVLAWQGKHACFVVVVGRVMRSPWPQDG